MNEKSIKQINLHKVEQGIWIVLLSVFLLSSVLKAVNINSFALETRLYMDAYFWELKSVMSSFETIRMEMVAAIAAVGLSSYKAYGSYTAANMSEEELLIAENVLAMAGDNYGQGCKHYATTGCPTGHACRPSCAEGSGTTCSNWCGNYHAYMSCN